MYGDASSSILVLFNESSCREQAASVGSAGARCCRSDDRRNFSPDKFNLWHMKIYVRELLVSIRFPSPTFSLLPTRRTNSAMISSSLASFVFDTRLMFSMTVFCDRIAVKERRCLSVKVIVDTLLSYADLFPLSPPKAPMFRVRSCDAAGSMDNKSSGETLVDVTDNFSRLAKP